MKRIYSIAATAALTLSTVFGANAANADTKVTISGAHLCCGACVRAVDKAMTGLAGVKHTASQSDSTITLTAVDDASAQKAVDALAAAGFHGKTDSKTVAYKPVATPEGNVKRLEVVGVHNCCGSCNKAIKAAVKAVPGVVADTAQAKQSSFVVEGDFNASALVNSLLAAGFHVEVKK